MHVTTYIYRFSYNCGKEKVNRPPHMRSVSRSHTCSGSLHVSVRLPGESSGRWKTIGTDVWQFDKVDLVS